jgi:hypothetical protein
MTWVQSGRGYGEVVKRRTDGDPSGGSRDCEPARSALLNGSTIALPFHGGACQLPDDFTILFLVNTEE